MKMKGSWLRYGRVQALVALVPPSTGWYAILFERTKALCVRRANTILALSFALASFCAVTIQHSESEIETARHVLAINQLSNRLYDGLSQWALDRGLSLSESYVQSGDEDRENLARSEIRAAREKSNELFLAILKELPEDSIAGSTGILTRIEDGLQVVSALRLEADGGFPRQNGTSGGERSRAAWFHDYVEEIWKVEEGYRKLLTSPGSIADSGSPPEVRLAHLLDLMRLVWQASEYAGQERAAIGALIAGEPDLLGESGMGDSQDSHGQLAGGVGAVGDRTNAQKLRSTWAAFEGSLVRDRPASLDQSNTPYLSRETREQVVQVRVVYFGRYSLLRADVLQGRGGNTHGYTADEWMTESTEAIDTLIQLFSLLRQDADRIATSMQEWQATKRSISLLLLLGASLVSIYILLLLWGERRRLVHGIDRFTKLNEVVDYLFVASFHWAEERGMVETGLNAVPGKVNRKELREQINACREKSDRALSCAQASLRRHALEWDERLVLEFESEYIEMAGIRLLREQADRELKCEKEAPQGARASDSKFRRSWFRNFTGLIDRLNEFQLTAFHLANSIQDAGRYESEPAELLALKHNTWIMSEFAGRERAKIAASLASNRPFPREQLVEYRLRLHSAFGDIKWILGILNDKALEGVATEEVRRGRAGGGLWMKSAGMTMATETLEKYFDNPESRPHNSRELTDVAGEPTDDEAWLSFRRERERLYRQGGCDSGEGRCEWSSSDLRDLEDLPCASDDCPIVSENGGQATTWQAGNRAMEPLVWFNLATEAISAIFELNACLSDADKSWRNRRKRDANRLYCGKIIIASIPVSVWAVRQFFVQQGGV